MERESEWERCMEHEARTRSEHPHARVIANRTSVPYDPITLQYHDGYEGERAKYIDASTRYVSLQQMVFICCIILMDTTHYHIPQSMFLKNFYRFFL